jgi:hypothetical protein
MHAELLDYIDGYAREDERNRQKLYARALLHPDAFRASFDTWLDLKNHQAAPQPAPLKKEPGPDSGPARPDEPGSSPQPQNKDELISRIKQLLDNVFPLKGSASDRLNFNTVLRNATGAENLYALELMGPLQLRPGLEKVRAELRRMNLLEKAEAAEDLSGST